MTQYIILFKIQSCFQIKEKMTVKNTIKLILAFALFYFALGNAWADLDDGLVAYYPFCGNADDESGNGNHGTVNGATLTANRSNKADSAYSFDGVNDYISVADGSSFNFTNNLSLSLWVNPGSSQSNSHAGLIDKSHCHVSNDGIAKSWVIQQSGDNTNAFWFIHNKNNTSYASSTVGLEANTWNHILVSKENGKVKFYKNGVLVSEDQNTVSSIETNGDLPLIIGSVNNCNRFFNGMIDDIRIYNRVLSESEVKSLYAHKDKCSSLLVTLANFKATSFQNGIRVHWNTASEADNLGFHLWRATGEGWKTGDYSQVIRLTEELIPSKGDKVGGYPYSYIDSNVESGITYYYGLVDIDSNGQSTTHWDFIDEATAK